MTLKVWHLGVLVLAFQLAAAALVSKRFAAIELVVVLCVALLALARRDKQSRATHSIRLPGGVELHPGEQVVALMYPWWMATLLSYVFTLGLWEIWRRRHYIALTNERLIYAKGIVFRKASRSVPLSRIQDATYERQFWAGGFQISSAGGAFGNLKDVTFRPREAKAFVHSVNDATRIDSSMGLGEERHDTSVDTDPANAIRSLTTLRNDGLITEEEYEAKRREVLARI